MAEIDVVAIPPMINYATFNNINRILSIEEGTPFVRDDTSDGIEKKEMLSIKDCWCASKEWVEQSWP